LGSAPPPWPGVAWSLCVHGKRRGPIRWEDSLGETSSHLWERGFCVWGGPEAAGKAPRTVKCQMPLAAQAQNQELAPKQVQHRHVFYIRAIQ
jgi:hypothetical protein